MKIVVEKIQVNIPGSEKILFRVPEFIADSGEKILIRGKSGAGKTTFLHLLAGLLVPNQGQIKINGQNISEFGDREMSQFRRHNIGMIFQKLNIIEHLTLLENIEIGQIPKVFSREKAISVLEQVGLKNRENEFSSVLSLGEQQRVAVARILSQAPPIVFADEPTSSLDEENAKEVISLLTKNNAGTLVVVSHDHRIEKFFSRIVNFGDLIK